MITQNSYIKKVPSHLGLLTEFPTADLRKNRIQECLKEFKLSADTMEKTADSKQKEIIQNRCFELHLEVKRLLDLNKRLL